MNSQFIDDAIDYQEIETLFQSLDQPYESKIRLDTKVFSFSVNKIGNEKYNRDSEFEARMI